MSDRLRVWFDLVSPRDLEEFHHVVAGHMSLVAKGGAFQILMKVEGSSKLKVYGFREVLWLSRRMRSDKARILTKR